MKYIVLLIGILCYWTNASMAQPANDICDDAILLTDVTTNCELYDFSNATFDVRNGSCSPAFSRNVWFTFEAIGTDISTEVNTNGGPTPYITLYEFPSTPCNSSSAIEIGCDTNLLALQNVLDIGENYYICVSFPTNYQDNYTLCIDNPLVNLDPANDYRCFPQAVSFDQNCVNGTTDNATFDLNNPLCTFEDFRSVWYSGRLSSGHNELEIEVSNLETDAEVAFMIGQFTNNNCGNDFILRGGSCFDSTGMLTIQNLIPGEEYVIMVSHQEADSQDFQICFREIGPPSGCAVNNTCPTAELIPTVSNGPQECVQGCNIGATFGPTLLQGTCYNLDEPTVWYHITTDEDADFLQLRIRGTDLTFPRFTLYGSCNNVVDTLGCALGLDSVYETFFPVLPNSDYYLTVSDASGGVGQFQLCVQALQIPNQCVVDDTLYAIATSFGSPLEGPYQKEERVTFRYEIRQWEGDACNKIAGIVPSYGIGWDRDFLNDDNAPIIVNMPQAVSQGEWQWFPRGVARYNFPNPMKSLNKGSNMPPGWYFVANNTPFDDPNLSLGDGALGCRPDSTNQWSATFTLVAKGEEDCNLGFNISADVSVAVYSDGEIGAGQYRGCQLVSGTEIERELQCCEGPNLQIANRSRRICAGAIAEIDFQNLPDIEEVRWQVKESFGILDPTDGTGLRFTQQLFLLPGISSGEVIYTFYPIDSTGCIGDGVDVQWDVFPTLTAEAGRDTSICEGESLQLGGAPTAAGGLGTNYNYFWGQNIPREPNPEVQVAEGTTTYALFVSDPIGCTAFDTIIVIGRPQPAVSVAPITDACAGRDIPLSIEFTGSPPFSWDFQAGTRSESFPAYMQSSYSTTLSQNDDFTLRVQLTADALCTADTTVSRLISVDPPRQGRVAETLCFGESINFNGITYDETGNYTIDFPQGASDGCDSSLLLNLNVLSEIVTQRREINYNDSTQRGTISLTIAGGLPPYVFDWSNGAPDLDSIGNLPAGNYMLTVTDQAGCTNIFSFMVGPNTTNWANAQEIRSYPNPVSPDQMIRIEMPEKPTAELDLQWIHLSSGKIIGRQHTLHSQGIQLNAPSLPGYYVLLIKDRESQRNYRTAIIVSP